MPLPVTIGIDASRATAARVTGTERYALEMIRSIVNLHSQHRFILYFREAPPPDLIPELPNVTHKVIAFPRLWTHFRLAAELQRETPDIFWTPAHTLPAIFSGKGAVTIHDLGFKHFPNAHPSRQRAYLEWTTQHSARSAILVFADSRATADDLEQFYGTSRHKIRVLYPGVAAPPKGDIEAVRARFNLPQRYFLFVGTLQPRKNIARLARAYAQWKAAHPEQEVGLVLAGGQGWLYDKRWTEGISGIIETGYVTEAEKGALLRNAVALVLPSLYEGFGFPVLEAMLCGTPVVCSNTSSLPELVGETGVLVNPLDEVSIAEGMSRISDDGALASRLKQRGARQAASFTWENAARIACDALVEAAHA